MHRLKLLWAVALAAFCVGSGLGCNAASYRVITPAGGAIEISKGNVGTDETEEIEIPVGKPTGVAALWGSAPVVRIKCVRTGQAESFREAAEDATIFGSIFTIVQGLPNIIGAFVPHGVNPKVVGPDKRLAVPAPPDPVPVPPGGGP